MNGVTQNGKVSVISVELQVKVFPLQAQPSRPSRPTSKSPGKVPAQAPVNVPPPPCAPYCPLPGQLKIEKRGKIVNDLVDIDFEQTVMK